MHFRQCKCVIIHVSFLGITTKLTLEVSNRYKRIDRAMHSVTSHTSKHINYQSLTWHAQCQGQKRHVIYYNFEYTSQMRRYIVVVLHFSLTVGRELLI